MIFARGGTGADVVASGTDRIVCTSRGTDAACLMIRVRIAQYPYPVGREKYDPIQTKTNTMIQSNGRETNRYAHQTNSTHTLGKDRIHRLEGFVGRGYSQISSKVQSSCMRRSRRPRAQKPGPYAAGSMSDRIYQRMPGPR